MEKNCIIMAVDNSKVNDSDTTQEKYIYKKLLMLWLIGDLI